MTFITYDFPKNCYYQERLPKKQIAIHHTVSGKGVKGDINWWIQNKYKIGACEIIDWQGNIYPII